MHTDTVDFSPGHPFGLTLSDGRCMDMEVHVSLDLR